MRFAAGVGVTGAAWPVGERAGVETSPGIAARRRGRRRRGRRREAGRVGRRRVQADPRRGGRHAGGVEREQHVVPGGATVALRGDRQREAVGLGAHVEPDRLLGHVHGVGDRARAHQVRLRDGGGIAVDRDAERGVVAHAVGREGDHRPLAVEQVRRAPDLRGPALQGDVARGHVGRAARGDGRGDDVAVVARRHHAAVGEQHGGRVVRARVGLGAHGAPAAGAAGRQQLGVVDRLCVQGVVHAPVPAAVREDRPAGQEHAVEVGAPLVEREVGIDVPALVGRVQVEDLGGREGGRAGARDARDHLAGVRPAQHHDPGGAVGPGGLEPRGAPGAVAGDAGLAGVGRVNDVGPDPGVGVDDRRVVLARARHQHLVPALAELGRVRQDEHVGVQAEALVVGPGEGLRGRLAGGQLADDLGRLRARSGRRVEHLHVLVVVHQRRRVVAARTGAAGLVPAADDQHPAVRELGEGRYQRPCSMSW